VLAVENEDRSPPQDIVNVFKVSGFRNHSGGRAVGVDTSSRQVTPYRYYGYLIFSWLGFRCCYFIAESSRPVYDESTLRHG